MQNVSTAFFTLLLLCTKAPSFCQGLELVPQIITDRPTDKDASFILTPGSDIEIIDAREPWPPRWFVVGSEHKKEEETSYFYTDARFQNGDVTFCKTVPSPEKHKNVKGVGYVTCNSKMQPVDIFNGIDLPVNYHDFRINDKGEKLFLARLDTVLNLSGLSGNPGDTAVKADVDIVEIVDSHNKLIFRWNPIEHLGINSLHYAYGHMVTLTTKLGYVSWSHANAISWDFDGNILYSFRHIGIGKISRSDGRVIWRIDRNKMPYIKGADTIAFYLQHGFDKVSDSSDYETYSLYSDGDSSYRSSYGLEFTVNKKNGEVRPVKRIKPPLNVASSRSGNFEIAANGDYLLNFGTYKSKADGHKPFLQYGGANGQIYALYEFLQSYDSYGVHFMNGWLPPRPEVIIKNKRLAAKGKMRNWTWYQLSGPSNIYIKKVSKGRKFSPQKAGTYCVAGKYGIGYSVSQPVTYRVPSK